MKNINFYYEELKTLHTEGLNLQKDSGDISAIEGAIVGLLLEAKASLNEEDFDVLLDKIS